MNGTGCDFDGPVKPVVKEDLMYIELVEEKSDVCHHRFSVYRVYQKGFEQVKKIVTRVEGNERAWVKKVSLDRAIDCMKSNFITLQITKKV